MCVWEREGKKSNTVNTLIKNTPVLYPNKDLTLKNMKGVLRERERETEEKKRKKER